MGKIIAMAGKGGTGKTTIAAAIVRLIKERKMGSVIAIDADPNSNLAQSLGVENRSNIGEILDGIGEKVPQGMTKDRFIQLKVQAAIQEEDGFDLLSMGKPEGPGCYCYVNNILRSVMAGLVKDYDYIIIDNEAGLEHLSRRTSRLADILIVVSDSSVVGLRSAKKVIELVNELKFEVKKSYLLVNRFNKDIREEQVKETGLDYLGNLPADPGLEKISLEGKSVFELKPDTAFLKAFNLLGDSIWKHN